MGIKKYCPRDLPYPKIEKTVQKFLTIEEYNQIIRHLSHQADSPMELRNLIIIMLLGMLGLRTLSLVALNIQDVDVRCGLLWVNEKARRRRTLLIPYVPCELMHKYLNMIQRKTGPLFLSKRKRRISQGTLQNIFREAADQTGIEDRVTPHVPRDSFATEMYHQNVPLAAIQAMMGHDSIAETAIYQINSNNRP